MQAATAHKVGMVIQRFSLTFLLLALLIQPQSGSAQDITVRLIDVRNGHAISNQQVSLQFRKTPGATLETLKATTGSDGTASFHMPQPLPETFSVYSDVDRFYPCYNLLPADTKAVLERGLVSRCSVGQGACKCSFSKIAGAAALKPGELLLPTRPFTRWERFLQHIWE